MNLLLLQNPDTDLYTILLSSETSRNILRFYRPRRLDHGILVMSASLGSSLSLASELRWYIRRYVSEVIFEIADGIYCTHALALDVYHREIKMTAPWKYRWLLIIGDAMRHLRMDPGTSKTDYSHCLRENEGAWEIWGTEQEYSDIPL
jgi:hypothetical protein